MKKTQFKIGLLTACLCGMGSIANAQSCRAESVAGKPCKCACKSCDDRGLLDVLNNAASSFEARLADMVPERDKPAKHKACGCGKCAGHNHSAMQYIESAPLMQITPPTIREEFVTPPMPVGGAPQPVPDSKPVSRTPAPDVVPLPDSGHDPFQDEAVGNPRPVPGRPASYLRSGSLRLESSRSESLRSSPSRSGGKPTVELDPQARLKTNTNPTSGSALATTKSTRRAQTHGTADNKKVPGGVELSRGQDVTAPDQHPKLGVVPASSDTPVSDLRAPEAPAAAFARELINPLRAR